MTLFPVPATTFKILKRGFDAPTPAILLDALGTSRQIRNDQERFLFIVVPTSTQIGLDLIFLPQTNVPIEPLARGTHQIRNRTGWQETTTRRPMFAGMLGTDAKKIVPAIFQTERDHWKASKSTISNDRTVSLCDMRS